MAADDDGRRWLVSQDAPRSPPPPELTLVPQRALLSQGVYVSIKAVKAA